MTLNNLDRADLESVSRENVKKTFAGLKRFAKKKGWIGKNNRYTGDTIKKIDSEVDHGSLSSPRQLSQYISASCVLHCSDGWSYLGRSIAALLRGDPHRSRHLAYYAELRAAMSLLASVGIGVFNNKHFIVDGPNSVKRLRRQYPTHQFVWDCLEIWGKMSGELFASVVRPNGQVLNDWLQPLGGGIAVAAQANQWFLQWGMDLKMPSQDRTARNESSYRPDGIPDSWCLNTPDTLKFIHDIWLALEPSPASRFDMIDRHILRIALESIFKGQTGVTSARDPLRFRALVLQVVQYQGLSEEATTQWVDFLCRKQARDNLSLFQFSQQSSESRDSSHAAIIARAALLLRMASGSTANLLQSIGFTASSMSFWWEGIGPARGLWDGTKGENGLIDLWTDMVPLLEETAEFQKNTRKPKQTFFRVGSELGHVLAGLGSCERVAIWSLAST